MLVADRDYTHKINQMTCGQTILVIGISLLVTGIIASYIAGAHSYGLLGTGCLGLLAIPCLIALVKKTPESAHPYKLQKQTRYVRPPLIEIVVPDVQEPRPSKESVTHNLQGNNPSQVAAVSAFRPYEITILSQKRQITTIEEEFALIEKVKKDINDKHQILKIESNADFERMYNIIKDAFSLKFWEKEQVKTIYLMPKIQAINLERNTLNITYVNGTREILTLQDCDTNRGTITIEGIKFGAPSSLSGSRFFNSGASQIGKFTVNTHTFIKKR